MDSTGICLIIDAHPLVRIGIGSLLAANYEVEELPDGCGAVELMTSVGNFDVAVVELRAAQDGVPSGTATIRELLGAQPALGVVALGGPPERYAIREAFDAGANAYVSKQSDPAALIDAVAAAGRQEGFVDPAAGLEAGSPLTRRQREVLQLFANGLATTEVAKRLGLSEETVRTHAKASLARIGARDRTHAVALAMRSSLID